MNITYNPAIAKVLLFGGLISLSIAVGLGLALAILISFLNWSMI